MKNYKHGPTEEQRRTGKFLVRAIGKYPVALGKPINEINHENWISSKIESEELVHRKFSSG